MKTIDILSNLRLRLHPQSSDQSVKGLDKKELDEVKSSYATQNVSGETIDRVNSLLVRLLENNPTLVTRDSFMSDFKQQLKEPFINFLSNLITRDKVMEYMKQDTFKNLFGDLLEWLSENKTVEIYNLSAEMSSGGTVSEGLALLTNLLGSINKEEITDDLLKLKCVLAKKMFEAQKLLFESPEKLKEIEAKHKSEMEALVSGYNDKKAALQNENEPGVYPIIGMVAGGLVTLFGLFQYNKSDEKTIPGLLTVLGLVGTGASAIWKWGLPKGGGGSSSSGGAYDYDDMAAGSAAAMYGHYHGHGDCGDGGGFFGFG